MKISFQVDGKFIEGGDGSYHTRGLIDITPPNDPRIANIHEVRFVVSQPPKGGVVTIKCVVLVYNNFKGRAVKEH